jgi:hypothetical protein
MVNTGLLVDSDIRPEDANLIAIRLRQFGKESVPEPIGEEPANRPDPIGVIGSMTNAVGTALSGG